MRTKLLTLVSVLLLSAQMFAHDFEVDGIYYHKLGGDSLLVTFRGDVHSEFDNEYRGEVNIPEQVYLNDSIYRVVAIGDFAFHYCPALTSITIPNSITKIGTCAFRYCSNLTTITIPNSVTILESEAFSECSKLASITLGSGLTTINPHVFYQCIGLTSVSIPDNITTIDYNAFFGCSNLTSINLGAGLKTIGYAAFTNTGLSSVTIPNSVTEIGISAFESCPNLRSVAFGTGLTATGQQSFARCPKLQSINLPENITFVSWYSFLECTGLQSVTLSNKVAAIGGSAFYNCSSLTSINIPNSVESIGTDAFYGCTALQMQTYGNGLYLGSADNPYYALIAATDSKITSCTVHKNTKIIAPAVFAPCTNLTDIIVEEGNAIYQGVGACLIEKASKTLIAGCANSVIPTDGSVTTIGANAFCNCTGLQSINVPNTISSIGGVAFQNCTSLISVSIPNSVTTFGEHVFYNCTNLSSVTLPTNMQTVPIGMFSGCKKLTSITLPESVTEIGNSAFESSGLKAVNISDKITTIGGYAFGWCDSLKTVTLGQSLQSIGEWAFYLCENLSAITIPNSVTSIGEEAFANTGLKSITIPDAVTFLGYDAFYGCDALEFVKIGNGIKTIEEYTFYHCDFIRTLVIGKNVEVIQQGAFAYTNLEYIYVEATTPPLIDDSGWRCFEDITYETARVTVPNCSLTDYQEAHGWQNFYNITEVTYTFEVAAQDSKTGFVQILQEHSCDQPAIVKALPMDNYKFQTWSDGNTESMRQIVVDRDIDLVALFVPIDENELATDVNVSPTDYSAVFTWPAVEGAVNYTLIVWADENQTERICTLTFDAAGRLSSIDFSKRKQAKEQSVGFGLNFTVMGLEANTKYGYALEALSADSVVLDSHTGTFTTKVFVPTIHNGHEYVDLGLPSGTLWATTNIGATSSEAYGDYFAWGETQPKTKYDWSTYKWGEYDESDLVNEGMTKYNSTDKKTTIELEDDAAFVNWGSGWRMPTGDEVYELINDCKWTLTTQEGIKGFEVTGKSGHSIFLPFAGYVYETDSWFGLGEAGLYWCSSPLQYNIIQGFSYGDDGTYLEIWGSESIIENDTIIETNIELDYDQWRCLGAPIRPVYDEQTTSAITNVPPTEKSSIRKVFENGTIYILRNGEKYTVDGMRVM